MRLLRAQSLEEPVLLAPGLRERVFDSPASYPL
jgi:hypothetical protein